MLVCVDTIYLDSLAALNLTADYLLLLASGRVAGAVLHRGRILLAAALGAAWALASVVPGWGFASHPAAKIALGVGMSLIAYGSERRFWRCCGARTILSSQQTSTTAFRRRALTKSGSFTPRGTTACGSAVCPATQRPTTTRPLS